MNYKKTDNVALSDLLIYIISGQFDLSTANNRNW